jgi:hypothetical protein
MKIPVSMAALNTAKISGCSGIILAIDQWSLKDIGDSALFQRQIG